MTIPMPEVRAQLTTFSVIVPARDEEGLIAETLRSVNVAANALQQPWEVLVVNDGSTDRTADIAREHGARVIDVELHNIGAVRNAGAREAKGDLLVFLDADTLLPPSTLRAAWDAVQAGAVGGGAWVQFDERTTAIGRWLSSTFCFGWQRVFGWAAGCFIFARRLDFEAVGGFDEQYFAAEERFLSEALRHRGQFCMLKQPVITSGRKLRLYSLPQLLGIAGRTLLTGKHRLRQREGLEILYDAPRERVV